MSVLILITIVIICFTNCPFICSFKINLNHKILTRSKIHLVLDNSLMQKLNSMSLDYNEKIIQLADPHIMNNITNYSILTKEKLKLEDIVSEYNEWKKLENEKISLREMSSDVSDEDIAQMAQKELDEVKKRQVDIEGKLIELLVPADQNDEKNSVVEVRAGAGGSEACLWASDLVFMYLKYSERKKWKVEHISSSDGDSGGYKAYAFKVCGRSVYSTLKYEVRIDVLSIV